MSGTVQTSFTDNQKVDIRRFCGYPAFGSTTTGFSNWRFFQAYGLLEYRLNNLAPAEIVVTLQYISTLASLEAAIPPSSANLDTDSAAAWKHNENEINDRSILFDSWRRRLCGFLGIPPGSSMNNTSINLVV